MMVYNVAQAISVGLIWFFMYGFCMVICANI